MAAHKVAIAKASLAASLIKAQVPRDSSASFHVLLQDVLANGSRTQIEACKTWLLENVVPSTACTVSFAKYLSAVASDSPDDDPSKRGAIITTSLQKKRTHILYLLNDLLHHTKYHNTITTLHQSVVSSFQPYLVALVRSAAAFSREKNQRHFGKLEEVLDIWTQNEYYAQEYVGKLRGAVKIAADDPSALHGADSNATQTAFKDPPYALPATHGDKSLPWHELPAGNLLPHIMPDSPLPIDPKQVKPLRMAAGPASEVLASAVRNFLLEVDAMPNKKREYSVSNSSLAPDRDAMGHPLVREGPDGTMLPKENHYGWSMEFCDIMKQRKRDGPKAARLPGVQRDRSLSPSDRSYSPNSPAHRSVWDPSSSSSSLSPSPPRRDDSRHRSRSRSAHRHDHNSQRAAVNQEQSQERGLGTRPGYPPDDLEQSQNATPQHQQHQHWQQIQQRPPFQQNPHHHNQPQQYHQQQNHYQNHQPRFPAQMQMPGPFPPPYNPTNAPLVTPAAQIHPPYLNHTPPPPPTQHSASYFQAAHNFPVDHNGLPIPPPPPFHTGPWPPPPPPVQGSGPTYAVSSPRMSPSTIATAGGPAREQGTWGRGQASAFWPGHYAQPRPKRWR